MLQLMLGSTLARSVGESEITVTKFFQEFWPIQLDVMCLSHISKVRNSSHISCLFVTCWSDVAKHSTFSTIPLLAQKSDALKFLSRPDILSEVFQTLETNAMIYLRIVHDHFPKHARF
jgi:hypothetical protein